MLLLIFKSIAMALGRAILAVQWRISFSPVWTGNFLFPALLKNSGLFQPTSVKNHIFFTDPSGHPDRDSSSSRETS